MRSNPHSLHPILRKQRKVVVQQTVFRLTQRWKIRKGKLRYRNGMEWRIALFVNRGSVQTDRTLVGDGWCERGVLQLCFHFPLLFLQFNKRNQCVPEQWELAVCVFSLLVWVPEDWLLSSFLCVNHIVKCKLSNSEWHWEPLSRIQIYPLPTFFT